MFPSVYMVDENKSFEEKENLLQNINLIQLWKALDLF